MSKINGNFVDEYVDYANECTNANDKYHVYASYTMLSQALMGNYEMSMPFGTYHPNLWVCLIGQSTLSHKTTSMSIALGVIREAGIGKFLPTDFSPEGLVESMSKQSKGYMWIDELGGLLGSMSREYMASGKELMMKLFSNQDVHRALSNKDIHVQDPLLGIFGTTTSATIISTIGEKDMFTGFMARMLHIYDDSEYEWKGIHDTNPGKRATMKSNLANTLKLINNKFNIDKTAALTPDAYSMYLDWDKDMKESVADSSEVDILSPSVGRMCEYGLKLAMIEEVAEDWDSISASDKMVYITEDSMEESIYMMNQYRANVTKKMTEILHGDIRMKVYNKIEEYEPIARSKLLRLTHMKAAKLSSELKTLEMMGVVKEARVQKNKGARPTTYYKTSNIKLNG